MAGHLLYLFFFKPRKSNDISPLLYILSSLSWDEFNSFASHVRDCDGRRLQWMLRELGQAVIYESYKGNGYLVERVTIFWYSETRISSC